MPFLFFFFFFFFYTKVRASKKVGNPDTRRYPICMTNKVVARRRGEDAAAWHGSGSLTVPASGRWQWRWSREIYWLGWSAAHAEAICALSGFIHALLLRYNIGLNIWLLNTAWMYWSHLGGACVRKRKRDRACARLCGPACLKLCYYRWQTLTLLK